MPHFPARLNSKGEGKSVPATLPFEMAKLSSRLGAVPARRFRVGLGIEEIHLAGAAVHEEVDDALGVCRESAGALGFRS